MSDMMSTHGTAYTSDPDYAAFTGRVVRTFTTTQYDPKCKAWIKRTVEYIDIGRPDSVSPNDPDEVIADDPWEQQDLTGFSALGNEAYARKMAQRHAEMQMAITAYLLSHGPAHVKAISGDLEYARIGEFMVKREGTIYCRVGNIGRAVLWGLVGIHDQQKESA